MPRSIFVRGDEANNNLFIQTWLDSYAAHNNISPEYYTYEYEPLGKKKYYGMKIAIFRNINLHEKEYEPKTILNSVKREISKLKKYNSNIVIIVTVTNHHEFYFKLVTDNDMYIFNASQWKCRLLMDQQKNSAPRKIRNLIYEHNLLE